MGYSVHPFGELPATVDDGRAYFVACSNAGRLALVSGPYRDRAAAIAAQSATRQLGERRDAFACFYSWGVAVGPSDAASIFGVVEP